MLSSTISTCRSPNAVRSEVAMSVPPASGSPTARPTVGSTRVWSASGASSTHTAPSAYVSATRRARLSASRVFPTPPGPTMVSAWMPGAASRSHSTSRSRSRPMIGVGSPGRAGSGFHPGAAVGTGRGSAEPRRSVADSEARDSSPSSRASASRRSVSG